MTPEPRTPPAPDPAPPRPLVEAVGGTSELAALCDLPWVPLDGGRVNRLWRAGGAVIKLHDRTAATPLYPNDAADEALALRAFGPEGLAPVLLGQGKDWVAYRFVPGESWTGRADRTGDGDVDAVALSDTPAAVALLLGRLHRQPVAGLAFARRPSGAAALLAQGIRIRDGCTGSLPPPPAATGPGPVAQPVPIHGDPVPGNLISGAGRLTLIDWQCPALGDPVEDLAAFLSPAMQWLYRGAPLGPAEAAAFLQAYPDRATVDRYRALAPLFSWRMAAHCLWRANRGARDYAQALQVELGLSGDAS